MPRCTPGAGHAWRVGHPVEKLFEMVDCRSDERTSTTGGSPLSSLAVPRSDRDTPGLATSGESRPGPPSPKEHPDCILRADGWKITGARAPEANQLTVRDPPPPASCEEAAEARSSRSLCAAPGHGWCGTKPGCSTLLSMTT